MAEQTVGAVLIGDEGYPLAPYLMKCYKNPALPHERIFNNILKKERNIIERAFGQLKQRFPILYQKIRISTERIPAFITACFILHNIAKYLQDPPFDEEDGSIDDNEENPDDNYDRAEIAEREVLRRGKLQRNAIANAISNR